MDRYYGNEWGRKGATISDKTARSEYGLTQDEIYDAIDAGKLQYRPAAMHGNPWLRLLRREVEDLARTLHGDRDVREKQARAEMARVTDLGFFTSPGHFCVRFVPMLAPCSLVS